MAVIFSKILCPIDFERDSMEALELACALAKQNSATVYLLTVIAVPLIPAPELPPVPMQVNASFEAECGGGWRQLRGKNWREFDTRFSSQVGTQRPKSSISPPNEKST